MVARKWKEVNQLLAFQGRFVSPLKQIFHSMVILTQLRMRRNFRNLFRNYRHI